jgi:hypothetical protein
VTYFPQLENKKWTETSRNFDSHLKIFFFYLKSIKFMGGIGAARAPKPGKAPIMAVRCRRRHHLLFFNYVGKS